MHLYILNSEFPSCGCTAAAAAAASLQSCPTLCDPVDGSPPGFPVPGIFQARVLKSTAFSIDELRFHNF